MQVQVTLHGNLTTWMTALPAQGTLPALSKAAVMLDYDFRRLAPQGIYNADVLITTSGTPSAKVGHACLNSLMFTLLRPVTEVTGQYCGQCSLHGTACSAHQHLAKLAN